MLGVRGGRAGPGWRVQGASLAHSSPVGRTDRGLAVDALFQSSAPSRNAPRGTGAPGYRLSSDELKAGLDVRAVSLTTLPPELVTELLRMRRSWGGDAFGAMGPGAGT